MEDGTVNFSGYTDPSSLLIDGIMSNISSLVQTDTMDFNSLSQMMDRYSSVSALQGEPTNNLRIDNFGAFGDPNIPLSRNTIGISNRNPPEQNFRGTALTDTSFATSHEILNGVSISSSSRMDSGDLRSVVSNNRGTGTSHMPCNTYMNFGHSVVQSDAEFLAQENDSSWSPQLDSRWEFDNPSIRNSYTTGWNSLETSNSGVDQHPYNNQMSTNDVSCAAFEPSIVNVPTIPSWSSEMTFSGSFREIGEQICRFQEPSLDVCTQRPVSGSQESSSGSDYLQVLKQILADVASFSLGGFENGKTSSERSNTGAKTSGSSNCRTEKGKKGMFTRGPNPNEFPYPPVESSCKDQPIVTLERREVESRKDKLLNLLQLVDRKYNECMDEIHTVISAFRAATELDAQIYTRFTLHTVSSAYKNLRDRIANQILINQDCLSRQSVKEDPSLESSFIQNQWALQQLKRKGHHLWRPQRGLPEKSVSVLRAWMFQNFLHPYPNDAEKHLLSIRSGLTRSQVSNWFINARVRLWKPMIEAMHGEVNSRKICSIEDEINSDDQSWSNISH
ncbi:hypothetical protein MKW98_027923 [Papaver atlanticum]|uniref:Homeobox domain-containing protein n=1 Tax=Papaver atlanticum TaxID=357466 RepID=A0AAD4XAS7_9MAGN|nr:hypothetical protein MKW98_027923 [Papaver atlanticum]